MASTKEDGREPWPSEKRKEKRKRKISLALRKESHEKARHKSGNPDANFKTLNMSKTISPPEKRETTGTVFIVQRPKPKSDGWVPDFSSASKYGRLDFIFDTDDKVWSNPTGAILKAQEKLKNFNPDVDYLLWPSFCDSMSLC